MSRFVDIEAAECFLHREDWKTPDETWRPESEFGAMLDALPTADVEPVKHGRWVFMQDKKDTVRCSVCGEPASYAIVENEWGDEQVVVKRSARCPCCGAIMDEKEVAT